MCKMSHKCGMIQKFNDFLFFPQTEKQIEVILYFIKYNIVQGNTI